MKLLSTLALVAFLTPCTIFAAGKSTQESLADFDRSLSSQRGKNAYAYSQRNSQPCNCANCKQMQITAKEGMNSSRKNRYSEPREDIEYSLGAEAFYGIACRDLWPKEDGDESTDGIDLYGVNLRFGMAFPTLFDVKTVVPELFVIAGYGYGEDTLYEESYYGEYSWWNDKFTGKSTMQHVSAGLTLNFELTDSFSISASGRIGLCSSKFELEYESDYYSKDSGTISEKEEVSDNTLGVIYGLGAGVHWTIAKQHKISFGVEYARTTAQPEIEEDDWYNIKLNKQNYVFFSVGYRFVF